MSNVTEAQRLAGRLERDDKWCISSHVNLSSAAAELRRLDAIVNTPQSDDFLRAVSTEAEHQRQRWGSEHDGGKTPADWFWLVGYLGGKALHAHASGNAEKAEHHIITTAAALANWHAAITGKHGDTARASLSTSPKERA